MKPTTNILERCAEMFTRARSSLLKATALLFKIREEELWKEKHESFSEYLDECQLDRSQSSRLLIAFEHFCIKGGMELTKLQNINPERLYHASKLDGTYEEQLTKALTLSPQDLKAQKIYEDTGNECTHEVLVCAKCGARVRNHEKS